MAWREQFPLGSQPSPGLACAAAQAYVEIITDGDGKFRLSAIVHFTVDSLGKIARVVVCLRPGAIEDYRRLPNQTYPHTSSLRLTSSPTCNLTALTISEFGISRLPSIAISVIISRLYSTC